MIQVSIIIPFKDKVDLLRLCVSSILEKTTFLDYEILLVDNLSTELKTKTFLNEIRVNPKIKIIEYNQAFNFSAINNCAVKEACGVYVIFLNNDTEVITPNWLDEIVKCFEDENVGVVGVKLLYPDKTIQHCGVMLQKKKIAVHAFKHRPESETHLEEKKQWSAVTGACLATKKELFLRLGGLDEKNLPIAYNDVDYCLRVGELDLKIICLSNIKLYHYESASRKSDKLALLFQPKRFFKFLKERKYMKQKWGQKISCDRFFKQDQI